MSDSPRLSLPYISSSQAQKEVTHNDALNDLDTLAQISVINMTTATPPGSPAEGDSYIVAASPTGAWAGAAGKIASYYSGWRIKTPREGWRAWVQNVDRQYVFDGTSWVLASVSLPASGYLNFGTTGGSSGYGVRDDGGTLEYKNSGGSWAGIGGGATSFSAGSAGAPGWAVTTDTDSGLFQGTANSLSIAAGGVEAARFNTAASGVNYLCLTPSATTAAVVLGSAGSDTNIPITITPKGSGGITLSNAVTGSSTVSATALIPTGSSAPASGLYLPTSTKTAIAANSAPVVTFTGNASAVNYFDFINDVAGNPSAVGVQAVGASSNIILVMNGKGTGWTQATSPAATGMGLVVKGATSQSANLQEWRDISNTTLASVDAAGTFTSLSSGVFRVVGVNSNTTASAANVNVDGSGNIKKSTSSRRYKKDVEDYTRGAEDLEKLRPVFYRSALENDDTRLHAGLIAEEVAETGLEEFVVRNEEGAPDALEYQNMVALLIAVAKAQTKEIAVLKARVEILEAT